jgi:hypothetical protein
VHQMRGQDSTRFFQQHGLRDQSKCMPGNVTKTSCSSIPKPTAHSSNSLGRSHNRQGEHNNATYLDSHQRL